MTGKWLLLVLAVLASAIVRAETMDDILALSQKGLGDEVLLATVERSPNAFTLSAADILRLKDTKVSDKVIAAMIRHRGAAVAEPKENIAVARRPAPVEQPETIKAEGTLNIENVDDRAWAYAYEPEVRTIWIAPKNSSGGSVISANDGISLRMAAGTYKIRYTGQGSGPAVTVFPGEKSLVMISRVETERAETLYASVFENGERKDGARIALLREKAAKAPEAEERVEADSAPVREKVIERERVVEVPSSTVIYRSYVPAPVIYAPPVYYPRCYAGPSYYYPSGYARFGYHGHSHHGRSGWSVGVGIGF